MPNKALTTNKIQELKIADVEIYPGEKKRINLKVAKLYDLTQMEIPVQVIRGKEEGPILFVSAAVHGDEINGVEIISKLLKHRSLSKICGTLIAVPIVNIFGFNAKSRYLPDRRDLNRCFPGTQKGSLAAQIANTFMEEIVNKCTHGIDLHSAATHRNNLAQIRVSLADHPDLKRMAYSFGAPVIIDSKAAEGTLRASVQNKLAYMVFEGGSSLRFEPHITKAGLTGVLNVMIELGMLPKPPRPSRQTKSSLANSTYWLRAPESGILHSKKRLGQAVKTNEVLGYLTDAFGEQHQDITASVPGIIIGQSILPLYNQGDAIYHIACFDDVRAVHEKVSSFIIDEDYYTSGV